MARKKTPVSHTRTGKPQLDKHFSQQRPIMNIKKVNAHNRPLRMAGITLCPLTPNGWQWRQLLPAQNAQFPRRICAGVMDTPAFSPAQDANQPGLSFVISTPPAASDAA